MNNGLLFHTLSIAYVMLIKMFNTGSLFKVFLSRFVEFLRSKVQFLILLVQITNHLVTCAQYMK